VGAAAPAAAEHQENFAADFNSSLRSKVFVDGPWQQGLSGELRQ